VRRARKVFLSCAAANVYSISPFLGGDTWREGSFQPPQRRSLSAAYSSGPRFPFHHQNEECRHGSPLHDTRPRPLSCCLVQKEMYPNVAARVDVYAPLGSDLIEHLNRIVGFNTRKDNPTSWQLEIHAGPDSLDRMLKEKPGNVVVISGRTGARSTRSRHPWKPA